MGTPTDGVNTYPVDAGGAQALGLWDATGQVFRFFGSAKNQGDANDGGNLVAQALWVWNGTTFDRAKSKNGPTTDGSGTITVGGAAQQAFAANADRKWFFFQNQSAGTLWINFGTTAVEGQPSIEVLPHNVYESPASFVSTELVSVIGATTAQAFVAKQG